MLKSIIYIYNIFLNLKLHKQDHCMSKVTVLAVLVSCSTHMVMVTFKTGNIRSKSEHGTSPLSSSCTIKILLVLDKYYAI